MEKIWFINVANEVEGPFTKGELKKDARLTPNTLVWRPGFDVWKAIKDVEELKDLFKDVHPAADEPVVDGIAADDELALQIQKEPPYLLFLILILILAGAYVAYLTLNNVG